MKSGKSYLLALVAAALLTLSAATSRAGFVVTNLVTDNQAVNAAPVTDPNLINPWGISMSATSPFWVSDNGAAVATLYSVNPGTGVPAKVGLTVSIPGDGSVTGSAFNGTMGFNGDAFLFVNEDGTISGWRGALGTAAETLLPASVNNVYKGASLATISGNAYLYAANFRNGNIDVLKGNGASANLTGNFTDPNLPVGFAPFNVLDLGGTVYVTYARQVGAYLDVVPGPGNGYVDAFDENGNLLNRVASAGALNSPWGLAIAPASFGSFAGDLLVGNLGDGRIDAFNLGTNNFVGPLTDGQGNPIAIDGLWALVAGNNGSGGNSNAIYFSAGPNNEADGLFGSLTPVPEPASVALVAIGGAALVGSRFRRRLFKSLSR